MQSHKNRYLSSNGNDMTEPIHQKGITKIDGTFMLIYAIEEKFCRPSYTPFHKIQCLFVITARAPSTKEGNVFTLCVHREGRYTAHWSLVSGSRSFLWQGYPSLWFQVPSGAGVGVPQSEPAHGYPSPLARTRTGVPPTQGTTCHGQDMLRVVRLLRSHRRIVLLFDNVGTFKSLNLHPNLVRDIIFSSLFQVSMRLVDQCPASHKNCSNLRHKLFKLHVVSCPERNMEVISINSSFFFFTKTRESLRTDVLVNRVNGKTYNR